MQENCTCGQLPEPIGALKTIQSYILQNSYIEQPSFALAASLCVLSTVLGRRFVFKDTAPNLFTLSLGDTSSGKDAPQKLAKKILLKCSQSNLIGHDAYVSNASLTDTLSHKPERLDTFDECSMFFSNAQSKESHTSGMGDTMCILWSSGNDALQGRAMASSKITKCSDCRSPIDDANIRGKCYRPSVNAMMATTYRGLEESVTMTALEKGLLGRFLLFTARNSSDSRMDIMGASLSTKVKSHIDRYRQIEIPLNDKYFNGTAYAVNEVRLAKDAQSQYDAYFDQINTLKNTSSMELQPIIGRMPQQFKKLSLIHAAGRLSADQIEVNTIDLDFAFKLCLYNLSEFSTIINKYLSITPLEKEYKRVLSTIKENNSGQILIDDIVFVLRPYLKRKRIMEILQELENAKQVERIQTIDCELGVKLI